MRRVSVLIVAMFAFIFSACRSEYEAKFLAIDKTTAGILSAEIQFCGIHYVAEVQNNNIISKIKISCEGEMEMIAHMKDGRSAKIMCGYFTNSAHVDILLEITDKDLL